MMRKTPDIEIDGGTFLIAVAACILTLALSIYSRISGRDVCSRVSRRRVKGEAP